MEVSWSVWINQSLEIWNFISCPIFPYHYLISKIRYILDSSSAEDDSDEVQKDFEIMGDVIKEWVKDEINIGDVGEEYEEMLGQNDIVKWILLTQS